MREEILIDAAEQVHRAVVSSSSPQADGRDQVDQLTESLLVEAGAGVVLGQHALEPRVVALDGDHRIVDDLADRRLLGAGLEMRPAGSFGHPEDVLRFVFVRVFGIRALVVALAGDEFSAVLLERVGDVLEEDEAEDDVLVFRRVHVVAELVGRSQARIRCWRWTALILCASFGPLDGVWIGRRIRLKSRGEEVASATEPRRAPS